MLKNCRAAALIRDQHPWYYPWVANENNNSNTLVREDDDPTAELEVLAHTYGLRERDASTDELRSELQSRSETIERLQFDLEQLRAKWTGLDVEIKARQEITESLNREITLYRQKLDARDQLLAQRDQQIEALRAESRSQGDLREGLQSQLVQAGDHKGSATLFRLSGQLLSANEEIRRLREKVVRTESYADEMRRQLQESSEAADKAVGDHTRLRDALREATENIRRLSVELAEVTGDRDALRHRIDEMHSRHAEEIRTVRFELGAAEETLAEQELVAEQLAADLIDNRGFRVELENTLTDNQTRIAQLEAENKKLLRELRDRDEKIGAKSEAISCLLAELARKSQQIESIDELGEALNEIDERLSNKFSPAPERDKVTRLLIGVVEGQKLRFPLFKNRLTIGRTAQNDIQLKASYVSRRHAVVVTDYDRTRVIDWGSKNGIRVNGEPVTEHFLKNGDVVTIGTADFRYEERPRSQDPGKPSGIARRS